MKSYAYETAVVRKLSVFDYLGPLTSTAFSAVAEASKRPRVKAVAAGLNAFSSQGGPHALARLLWKLHGCDVYYSRHPLVTALWHACPATLGTLSCVGARLSFRLIEGIPVGWDDFGSVSLPCPPAELVSRVLAAGSHVFSITDEDVSLAQDHAPVSDVFDERTRDAIDRVKAIEGCRALTLHGPPRGGKSMAARQIAREVAGTWTRVEGSAAQSPELWAALELAKPQALIFDDLDVNAGEESVLMSGLERAQSWARVIVSTVNVLNAGAHGVRGAVIAPGRASDELPIEYRTLSPAVREAIAPSVPGELRDPDLLAAYLQELERRAKGARGVRKADVDELKKLQAIVGSR